MDTGFRRYDTEESVDEANFGTGALGLTDPKAGAPCLDLNHIGFTGALR